MRERGALWQKICARGDFGLEARAVIAGKTYTAVSAPVIERALCDSALSVGNCIAASLRFSVLTQDAIPPGGRVVIEARAVRGEDVSEWKEFGTFFIDRREEQAGLTTLQCFDAMLKASQQYADPADPEDRIGWPKTMKACVEEIAWRIGVGVDPRTVIKTSAPYQAAYPDRLTMRQVLGHIGACHGGNWIITPENKLRLVPLVRPPAETFNIVDYEYNKIFTGGGYKLVWKHTRTGETVEHPAGGGLVRVPVVTGSISTGQAVAVTRATLAVDEDLGYTKGDSTGGEIRIEDNPYACEAICNDLYAAFDGLEYVPCAIEGACFDPCAELGDWLLCGDKVRSVLYKETLTFGTAFQADCEAPCQEETASEYPYLSAVRQLKQADKRLEKYMEAQKDEIHSQILQTRTDILLEVGGTYATQEQVSSSIKINADAITSEVTRAKGQEEALASRITQTAESITSEITKETNRAKGQETQLSSRIEQTAESVTSEVTRAKGQEAALSSKIAQTAKSITLSVENGTASSTIKLTGEGITAQSRTIKFTGDVVFKSNLTDGKTAISGENITTGKIASQNGKVYFDLNNNQLRCDRLISTSSITAINGRAVQPAYADITRRNTNPSGTPRYLDALRIYNGESESDALLLAPGNSSSASTYFKYKVPTVYGKSLALDADEEIIMTPGGKFEVFTDLNEGISVYNGHVGLQGDAVDIVGKAYFNLSLATADTGAYAVGLDKYGQLRRLGASSRRYKREVGPVTEELLDPRRLYGLPVCQYVFKKGYLSPDDQRQGKKVIGLIAEDVAEHYPIAASYDQEGRVENWQERYIVPAMLALLQEQHREIGALKKRLEKLENEKEDENGGQAHP